MEKTVLVWSRKRWSGPLRAVLLPLLSAGLLAVAGCGTRDYGPGTQGQGEGSGKNKEQSRPSPDTPTRPPESAAEMEEDTRPGIGEKGAEAQREPQLQEDSGEEVRGAGKSEEDTRLAPDISRRPPQSAEEMAEDIRRRLRERAEAQRQRQIEEGGGEAAGQGDAQVGTAAIGLERVSTPEEGQLWRGIDWLRDNFDWVEIPDESLDSLKEGLQDQLPSRINFDALGMAVIGGAVLGVVIRGSGSWFFGGPVEPHEYHPLLKKAHKAISATVQGSVRGGGFAGGCYLLLTGLDPFYSGLYGQAYGALAAATVTGGMASGAALNIIQKIVNMDFSQPPKIRRGHLGRGLDKLEKWTTGTKIGKGVRYKVVPGLVMVGVGAGVGVWVFHEIQRDSEEVSHEGFYF